MANVCDWCGKPIPKDVYITAGSGDLNCPYHFCSQKCRTEFQEKQQQAAAERAQAKAEKKQAKIAEKERKEAKKQEILEKSKVTSDENLDKIFKLCLIGGLVSLHRFAVGKIKSAVILDLILIFVVFSAISNKAPEMLIYVLINVAFWVIDLITIKMKKFTDKYGYTIRN